MRKLHSYIIVLLFLFFNHTITAQIGIGTDNPSSTVDIVGGNKPKILEVISTTTNTEVFTILDNGNIGINETTPQEGLHINGGVRINSLGGGGSQLVGVDNDGNLTTTSINLTGTSSLVFITQLTEDKYIPISEENILVFIGSSPTELTELIDLNDVMNPSNGEVTVKEDGLYRLTINYDYSLTSAVSVDDFQPVILYGLFNTTDNKWVYSRYEYLITNRKMSSSAGQSVFVEGYINLQKDKVYRFAFNRDLFDNNTTYSQIIIKATNSGSTGTSSSTFFSLDKIIGL